MKKRCAGFTLLELMAAMLIIVVIAGLLLGIYNYVNARTNRTRALAEIKTIGTAISSYVTDFGGPPQTDNTDALELKTIQIQSYDPTSDDYQKACLDLYKALSGDPGGSFNFTHKTYLKNVDIKKMVKLKSNGNPDYIKDPYGYSYGYSTAVLKLEQNFKDAVRKDGRTARRPSDPVGFSSGGYDLWSTAGNKRQPANLPAQNLLWLEWVKN